MIKISHTQRHQFYNLNHFITGYLYLFKFQQPIKTYICNVYNNSIHCMLTVHAARKQSQYKIKYLRGGTDLLLGDILEY